MAAPCSSVEQARQTNLRLQEFWITRQLKLSGIQEAWPLLLSTAILELTVGHAWVRDVRSRSAAQQSRTGWIASVT